MSSRRRHSVRTSSYTCASRSEQIDSNPQSALLRHRTQWLLGSQYGRAAMAAQSELDAHSTHAPVEALHAGAPAGVHSRRRTRSECRCWRRCTSERRRAVVVDRTARTRLGDGTGLGGDPRVRDGAGLERCLVAGVLNPAAPSTALRSTSSAGVGDRTTSSRLHMTPPWNVSMLTIRSRPLRDDRLRLGVREAVRVASEIVLRERPRRRPHRLQDAHPLDRGALAGGSRGRARGTDRAPPGPRAHRRAAWLRPRRRRGRSDPRDSSRSERAAPGPRPLPA